jgi:hypothetical protein
MNPVLLHLYARRGLGDLPGLETFTPPAWFSGPDFNAPAAGGTWGDTMREYRPLAPLPTSVPDWARGGSYRELTYVGTPGQERWLERAPNTPAPNTNAPPPGMSAAQWEEYRREQAKKQQTLLLVGGGALLLVALIMGTRKG